MTDSSVFVEEFTEIHEMGGSSVTMTPDGDVEYRRWHRVFNRPQFGRRLLDQETIDSINESISRFGEPTDFKPCVQIDCRQSE